MGLTLNWRLVQLTNAIFLPAHSSHLSHLHCWAHGALFCRSSDCMQQREFLPSDCEDHRDDHTAVLVAGEVLGTAQVGAVHT